MFGKCILVFVPFEIVPVLHARVPSIAPSVRTRLTHHCQIPCRTKHLYHILKKRARQHFLSRDVFVRYQDLMTKILVVWNIRLLVSEWMNRQRLTWTLQMFQEHGWLRRLIDRRCIVDTWLHPSSTIPSMACKFCGSNNLSGLWVLMLRSKWSILRRPCYGVSKCVLDPTIQEIICMTCSLCVCSYTLYLV